MYVVEAADLSIGAPVRVDGIDVGIMEAKHLAGNSANPVRRIELLLRVEKRDQEMIRSDSVAALAAEGLWGRGFVDIERGFRGSPLTDGAEIAAAPTRVKTIDEVIDSVAKWADCVKKEKNSVGEKSSAPIKVPPKAQR
jgi:ABC-type transporter Mla subunit MlaD